MNKLILIAPDGEHVTEGPYKSIQEAWEAYDNMGSRWFFYPFCFVTGAEGKRIVSAPTELPSAIGKSVKTVKAFFASCSEDEINSMLGH